MLWQITLQQSFINVIQYLFQKLKKYDFLNCGVDTDKASGVRIITIF